MIKKIMIISEIKDKNTWEDFLLRCEEKTFLQSWNWGEFNKMMGNKIWRLGIYDNKNNGDPTSVALVIKIVAQRGTFLMVQNGPIIKIFNFPVAESDSLKGCFSIFKQKVLEILLEKLKKIAKEENCSFIRIASLLIRNEENKKLFQNLGFREAPMHANAYEATWKLDIMPSEEELLMNMRKTTRYLIRQAQKNKDIEIFQSKKLEEVNVFEKLQQEVVKKQHFVPFPLNYLKNEFLSFQSDNQISLFFGKYKSEIIASAFVIFWSGIGFYHHAALSPKYHKIPIAYLLQWEAIKEAKKQGCSQYDFWGYVDPKKQSKHPWAGPTLFKMGFGGYKKEYVKTQDFSLSKKYWLTFAFEKLRKFKRGL